jgi:hypothetical protein
MEKSAKARLPLWLYRYNLSFDLLMNFHSYPISKWGESNKAFRSLCFWRLMPKGERVIGPKQKNRIITTFSKKCFKMGEGFFKLWKPSWQLKGELLQGELLSSQRKSIWNKGRIFKNLKIPFEIIFLYHWLFAKEFEKIYKNYLSGANVVQNVKLDQSNHKWLKLLSFQSNLCRYDKLQTNCISTLCICFGLCWHQSPKRGRFKGKWPQYFL